MKNVAAKSIVVLTVICLVISLLLAFINGFTAPIIQESIEKKATEALYAVLPDATGFDEITGAELPETIETVYKDQNGTGYAFKISAVGYNGSKPMSFVVGIDNDGKITSINIIDISGETTDIGTKVGEASYLKNFEKADANLEGVDLITGATVSSKAFTSAVKDVFTAYDAVASVDGSVKEAE